MDPLFAGAIGILVGAVIIAITQRARRPNAVATVISPLELEERLKILEEQTGFNNDRFNRQRGQLLTLSRRLARLERRIEEPPLEDDELEDELEEEDEFPEDEFQELQRKRKQGGAGG